MNIVVDILKDTEMRAYADFVDAHPEGLFFHSLKYREFLSQILGKNRSLYIAAKRDGCILGVLPAFIQDLGDGRTVINSLPFYGSHGGILLEKECDDKERIAEALINRLLQAARDEKAISLTLIDNLLNGQENVCARYLKTEATDRRVGQITDMRVSGAVPAADGLMLKFHSKTRNMVRKSEKSGFTIELGAGSGAFDTLYDIHVRNMAAIGGRAKPRFVFQAIEDVFENGRDYQIYFAKRDGKIAAGLLLFYYREYCEYYTPVIEAEFRSDQPLSLLIFQAMQDAVERGCTLWNWGGTWLSQDGVYLFKKRWGADDKPYNYYTLIFDEEYIQRNGQQIIDNSFFYVYPKTKAEERPAA